MPRSYEHDRATPSFVGRARELAALGSALDDAAPGRLRVVVVEGDPGIGKTRLVTEAASAAVARGFRVHRAFCLEHERARAVAPVASALGCVPASEDRARAEIAALLAESAPPRGDLTASHFQLIEGLLGILERAALERPTLFVLEDVHWADAATLAFVRTVASRLPFVALAIVLTTRPVPLRRALRRLLADLTDAGAVHLDLAQLADDDVHAIVREALGADPDESLRRFVRRAEGNPLYVTELLDALVREDAVSVGDETAALVYATMPPDLRRTILRRLSFLGDDALEALRLASVLGSTFTPDDLAGVAGRTITSLAPTLDECMKAGLVTEHEGALRFRHDLIREALYLDLPEPMRAALHRDIARALARAGAAVTQIAVHHAAGATPGDRDAIDTIRRAALAAERSPATAAELLERAAELAEPHPELRDEILADHADALSWSGRTDEAEGMARDVLVRRSASDLGRRLRMVVIRSLWFAARYAALVDACREWLGSAAVGEAERAELLAFAALAGSVPAGGPTDVALREAQEALDIGERLDDNHVRFYAARALSQAYGRMGRTAEQLEAGRRALELAEADATGALMREQPHLTLAQAYHEAAFRGSCALGGDTRDYVAACEQLLTDALRVREQRGTLWDAPAYLTLLALLRLRQGNADDALAEAEAAIAAAAETGTRLNLVNAHLVASTVLSGRGDLDAADRHIVQAEAIVALCGNQVNDPRRARLQLHFFRLQWADAADVAWSIFGDMRAEDASWAPYGMTFCLVQAGRLEDARAVASHAEASAQTIGTPEAVFQARFARALADADVAWLSNMVEASPQAQDRGDTGVWLMASCILGRAGITAHASRAFKKSVERYEGFLAERYGAIARGCGVPVRLRRRAARPRTGWEALSDTEVRVVELAAEGLTNPQIGELLHLSRRTVQSHLSHVFAKLGISSRVELAAAVARRSAGA